MIKAMCVSLLLLLPVHNAFAGDTLKKWNISALLSSLKMLDQEKESHKPFTETRYTKLLKKPVISQGTLTFLPPHTFIKTVSSPVEEEATISGNTVTLKRREAKGYRIDRIALNSHPALEGTLGSLVHLMRGEKAALEALFTIEARGSAVSWELVLAPRNPEMLEYLREVRIEGGKGDIRLITYLGSNGDKTLLRLGE